VGFEPRPYSRFLKTETRVRFSNIFIFLSAVYYVYPVSVVPLVLIQNRHQTDTKLAERVILAAKTPPLTDYNGPMTAMSSASENLLDEYMEALDRYGLACTERDDAETGQSHADPAVVEDQIRKTRWEYCQARQRYRHRKKSAA
jgi:hypothetical protein